MNCARLFLFKLLVMYRTHCPDLAGYCHFCLISGSGRISFYKKDPGPVPADPNRDAADSDLVSKKEYTEKVFFEKQILCKFKKVILYRWLNYITLFYYMHQSSAYLPKLKLNIFLDGSIVHPTSLHLFTFKL